MNLQAAKYIKEKLRYIGTGTLRTCYSYLIWGKADYPKLPEFEKYPLQSKACFAKFFEFLRTHSLISVCRLRISLNTKVTEIRKYNNFCPFTKEEISLWITELIEFIGDKHLKYKLVIKKDSLDLVLDFRNVNSWIIAFSAIYARLLYESPDTWLLKEALSIKNYSDEYRKYPLFSILMGLASSKESTHAFGLNSRDKNFKILTFEKTKTFLSDALTLSFGQYAVDRFLSSNWPYVYATNKEYYDNLLFGYPSYPGSRLIKPTYVAKLLESDTPEESLINYFESLRKL